MDEDNTEFYIQIIIFFIALLIISIVYYYYYTDDTNIIKAGYTYYGKDIINDKPIFVMDALNSKDCIQRCVSDAKCGGITYDIQNNSGNCTGAPTNALFRKDEPRYIGWKKGASSVVSGKNISYIFGISNNNYVIESYKLPPSPFLNKCLFSMWLYIKDWQYNYKYWKHILHKGTSPQTREYIQEWSAIDSLMQSQYIGLWLHPFENKMRVAITTQNQTTPNCYNDETSTEEICKNLNITNTKLEYYDIADIPIRKLIHVAISLYDNYLEIYINAKLHTTYKLGGIPQYNNGNLYIKNNISFSGDIYNFTYMTQSPTIDDIDSLYQDKPKILK